MRSREARNVFTRLAELSVHGANVQKGQIVLVQAEIGNGFPFVVEDTDRERANVSAQHIDFMIGSAELDVDGVTADGERVPVLRKLAWQL